jgi:predicted GNAT superfamily acetyltransferase
MIIYKTSQTEKDLLGILELQKNNLPANLTEEEISKEGFVTVMHNLNDLKKMNEIEQSIIAKDGDKVIAYLIAMTAKSKNDIPVLLSMFENFDKITFHGNVLSSYNYIVVGQVCVAKGYRGQGILDNCYAEYKKHFQNKYDFAITEIAAKNLRSINAHKRIGFKEVHRFIGDGVEWSIVLWDWKNVAQ